jgi:hypothetical protein
MYQPWEESEVFALLTRLVEAGDITADDRALLAAGWNSGARAHGEEADYWSLRLLRDLSRAITKAEVATDDIDAALDTHERRLVRSLALDLDRLG